MPIFKPKKEKRRKNIVILRIFIAFNNFFERQIFEEIIKKFESYLLIHRIFAFNVI